MADNYLASEYHMELSSRNQLKATVKEVNLGGTTAEVIIELDGGAELVAAITRRSAERLGLKPGGEVFAIIKATEVMVGR
ncbi:MAG: TOBE domain-containing protein [Tepidiformaceae bacterium]